MREVDVHSNPGPEDVDCNESNHQGDRGEHFKIDQRLQSHPSNLGHVGHAGDAMHNRAEDNGRDEDANCFYERISQRLHLGTQRGIKVAQGNAYDHCDEHLKPQLKVPRLSFLALNRICRCINRHHFLACANTGSGASSPGTMERLNGVQFILLVQDPVSWARARTVRSTAPSHDAITIVASALPRMLTATKPEDIKRCTPRRIPTAATGIVPVAARVDTSTTIADPATPAPPLDVTSRIPKPEEHWHPACVAVIERLKELNKEG